MDSFKTWLLEVGLKKMGPSLLKTGLAALVGLLAAHQGMLTSLGIVYDATAQTVTLHLDALQTWLLAGGMGLITALMTASQHHVEAAVTGQPQDGSHERATDPIGGVTK